MAATELGYAAPSKFWDDNGDLEYDNKHEAVIKRRRIDWSRSINAALQMFVPADGNEGVAHELPPTKDHREHYAAMKIHQRETRKAGGDTAIVTFTDRKHMHAVFKAAVNVAVDSFTLEEQSRKVPRLSIQMPMGAESDLVWFERIFDPDGTKGARPAVFAKT